MFIEDVIQIDRFEPRRGDISCADLGYAAPPGLEKRKDVLVATNMVLLWSFRRLQWTAGFTVGSILGILAPPPLTPQRWAAEIFVKTKQSNCNSPMNRLIPLLLMIAPLLISCVHSSPELALVDMDSCVDSDKDGVSDVDELRLGLDPRRPDNPLKMLSNFAGPVFGVQKIQVKIDGKFDFDPEEILLTTERDELSDAVRSINLTNSIVTIQLDTTLLPNGLNKMWAAVQLSKGDTYQTAFVTSKPFTMEVANDVSWAAVYDSKGNLVQEGWNYWFGTKLFPIRASAIHYKGKKVLPIEYRIVIKRENTGRILKTIVGSNPMGLIKVDWDLVDEEGNHTTDSSYDVSLDVAWPSFAAAAGGQGGRSSGSPENPKK